MIMQSFASLRSHPSTILPEKAIDARAKTGLFCLSMANLTGKRAPSKRQIAVAQDVILQGKSFRQASLDAGYAETVANQGPSTALKNHPLLAHAFVLASKQADLNVETVKQVAKYRLFDDVVKAKDSGVTRQIELLGRMKEHDWFVRNTDVQIGVFASLADDSKVAASVEGLTAELPAAEEPEK